jgi:cholest-4-en-3-one 26-monooxygenase
MSIDASSIDVLSPAVYVDGPPFEQLAWLRANAPIYEQTLDDPKLIDRCWVVSRSDDVRSIGRDSATFSSASGIHLRRSSTHQFRPNMINMDDPAHHRIRKLVSGAFTPRVMRSFQAHYGELARAVATRARANDSPIDGVRDLAAELPLLAICEIVGAPAEDRLKIFNWSNVILSSEDPDYVPTPEAFQSAVMALVEYAGVLAEQRRRDPGDDLISALLNADGELPLSQDEYEGLVLLLLAAGNETTRSGIAHAVLAFAQHPDQWDALRKNPDAMLDTAVEEVVRWASPVNYMARTATRDVELHGCTIRAGDKVALMYSSANRDDSVFDEPTRFDVTRSPNPHIGFGFGAHFCLGASLARIEIRALLEVLVDQVAGFEVTGPVRRAQSSFLNAIKELPLRLT